MLKPEMKTALNEQMNAEFYSSYLYLAMAAHCADQNLVGMSHWLRLQAQEELAHAMKIFGFILDRGGDVDLLAIGSPKAKWQSALDVFQDAYDHECEITKRIHDLVSFARKKDDVATEVFLQWYVTEQVEEEATAQEILHKLQRATQPDSLLVIDQLLGKRIGTS